MPFLSNLKVEKILFGDIWILLEPFGYHHTPSEHLNFDFTVTANKGFQCDQASIPRLPIIFLKLGDRFQEEGTIHDFVYRKDGYVTLSDETFYLLTQDEADRLLYDMLDENPMVSGADQIAVYNGVVIGGKSSYHKKLVTDIL